MRRSLIRGTGLLGLLYLAPRLSQAGVQRPEAAKTLSFHNLHTGERLTTEYWARDEYQAEALAQINVILRDYRTGEVKTIAPSLLDLVHSLRRALDTSAPVQIISGYRSPATNAMLAAQSGGVARHSLHLLGEAIDLRIRGRDLKTVHRAALALRAGGVGYYPRSGFVHVDIGRVRSW